jgi:hypothetical protein
MPLLSRKIVVLALVGAAAACGSDDGGGAGALFDSGIFPGTSADTGIASGTDAGSFTPPVGSGSDSGSGTLTPLDSGSAARDTGVVSVGADGATADAGPGVTADASTMVDAGGAQSDSGGGGSGSTSLTGMLGALGAVQPTVSGFVISNSGETLVYLTSAPLTCAQLKVSRWLGSFTAGAQVVEIVIKGAPKVGTAVNVGVFGGEVNYAAGGKSSAYEQVASSGSITFTKSEPMGVVEGTVTATYPMGSVMGTFHAEFCAGGQGY